MQITKVIKDHGLDLQQVADAMGISKGTLSLTIHKANPTYKTLKRIADICNADITEFFADETQLAPTHRCPHCGREIKITLS